MTRFLLFSFFFMFSFSISSQSLVRGPYLQTGTPTSTIVKWRTSSNSDSKVWYGSSPTNLTQSITVPGNVLNHEVNITGLSPQTQYYYAIGSTAGQLSGADADHFFITSPTVGLTPPLRFWVLGDCGTGNSNAIAVRNAYYAHMGSTHTDGVLLLGDNAYNSGTDNEYQTAIFNIYGEMLKKSVFWSTPGNHDYGSASASNQSGPYYDIFSFPENAEAGGLASGTESYFSFDVGNVHFISLDSHDSDRSVNGDQLTWLENDLSATLQDWIVVIFHHPPYTKGSHDSDSQSDSGGRMTDMRTNVLPILESHGVDLVLSGHSHSYERSYLTNGHYGLSSSYNASTMQLDGGNGQLDNDGAYAKESTGPNAGLGAVYITAGSSGKISGGQLNHPVMYYSASTLGSLALTVDDDQLNLEFVNSSGNVDDYFTINKAPIIGNPPTVSITNPSDGVYYNVAQTINIQANAQDSDGTISQVEFFANGSSIGTDNTAPYTINYAIPGDGSYNLTARATDNDANATTSSSVTILVGTINTVASLNAGSDDAEENSSNAVNITSTDLELTTDGTSVQTVGMRFTNVQVPQGAIISNAFIQFTVDETSNVNPSNLTIHGQASDNPVTFTTASSNISNRPTVSSTVNWSPSDWTSVGAAGSAQATPDISSIVQEIIDRPGFSQGNALVLTITGTGRRTAESYNGESAKAAKLHIEYSFGCLPAGTPCDDGNPATENDVEDGNCGCAGTPCPTAGTSCDDGDPNTINDIEDGNCNCAGTPTSVAINIQINHGDNDVEEREGDGLMYFTSSDIELVFDSYQSQNNQTVGLRFENVNVPKGATISNAYIQFTTNETGTGPTSLNIEGEDTDNASPFISTNYNVSSRTRTSASVSWSNIPAWNSVGASGVDQQSTNISTIIEEIVHRGGWNQGNAVVLIITGSGSRTAESYNGSSTQAATLHIEYNENGCSDTDNDGTCDEDDGCPDDPNKINPGDCGCGVADVDSDNDGTPDCNDACPNDPDKIAPGDCGCGVSDVDSDNDGIPDCNDGCPNDPNKIAPGECGCGVADVDTDNDGTPDCNDACPNDPNKIAPGDCGCGVTEVDSDNDGVNDCNDQEINSPCPNTVDANGVSIDTDRDGVCDDLDICSGGDDNIDTDGDGTPDFCDSCNDLIDTDSDGVNDCNDQEINSPCPNNVNANGVSIDTDGDGVCDDLDVCSGGDDNIDTDGDGTPDFCDPCNDLIDTDNDGVNDCIDQEVNSPCPNTVDAFGISIDSDGDGVCDDLDICSGGDDNIDTDGDGTPDFCDSCNDLIDTDNDGVSDCNDQEINSPCPNTVDANGVSIDTDGDGVCDDLDICSGGDDNIDTDGDGTPDFCDPCNDLIDTDSDGVNDCNDQEINSPCPNTVDAFGVSVDSDGDGVCDDLDICSGGDDNIDTDGDGTPDFCDPCNDLIDTDIDGVNDCIDQEINSPCPDNVDANGVSLDSDNDGTVDCNDGCPNDPDKIAPGICGCGVADTDSDNDGTLDCNDGCPDDPNKTDAGICGCGVSDQDSDNDGVADCNDLCPDLDDALIGTSCDDDDPTTENDTYNGNCECIGTPIVGCDYVIIDFNDFNSTWGIWNDGGSDCRRNSKDAIYSNGGIGRSVRLRDNTSTSVATTDNLDLTLYEEITVDFNYYARSMDNSNEDFWLQISTDGGLNFTTIEEWNLNDEFVNDVREFDNVVISGPFTSNTQLRFRCDASGNSDWVYIDDVEISGCLSSLGIAQLASEVENIITTIAQPGNPAPNRAQLEIDASYNIKAYPNPTSGNISVDISSLNGIKGSICIYDVNGKLVSKSEHKSNHPNVVRLDLNDIADGVYFMKFHNPEVKTEMIHIILF